MPIQAPQWTEFLSCPVCYNVFNEKQYRPISLACGHTVCHSCLCKLQQRKCPFDQSLITRDVGELPVNFALLQLVCATALPDNMEECVPGEYKTFYDSSIKHLEELALLLKPVSSSSTGSIITVSSSSGGNSQNASNSVLSRPMQRKLITLVSCQLVEDEGRARAIRAARSLGERSVTELILQHQNPQQLSSNLWASVRGRGCQFLGPAMQEEVLKLILLALEDGSALSRKVLVLFVVQRLETHYPQASKTAIGHVVQLLYRASCFKVTKREEESSLMQLKEEYRTYDMLRREHDSQIVQIAMEAGLRIAPDQWSSLLYGDATHKSHMQSIIDKLQTPQTFSQSVSELLIALQRTGDPHNLQRLQPELEFLSSIDPSPDIPVPSWENLDGVMKAVHTVVEGLVDFLQNSVPKRQEYLMPHNARYKTSMCRDYAERGNCPRGATCTFAHSEEELDRYRHKNKRAYRGSGSFHGAPTHVGNRALDDVEVTTLDNYRESRQDLTHVLKSMNINVSAQPLSNTGFPSNQRPGLDHDESLAPPTKQEVTPMAPESPVPVVEATPASVAHPTLQVAPPSAAPLATVVPIEMPDGVITPTGEVVLPSGDGAGNQQNVTQLTPQLPNMQMMTNQIGNVNIHPGMMQGMVPPHNMGIPQGNPGMMQIGPMQGMYPPFMPPYGGPGPGMHGPRFPIHPMMYHGQYPYMHPYMPYYPQGYMTPGDPSRMPYDNYYTSLNPFAEPWNPGSRQRPPMNQGMMYQEGSKSGQMETCAACSQRQQEEQRQRQKMMGDGHLCQHHSPSYHGDERSQGHGHEEQFIEAQRGNKYIEKTGGQEKHHKSRLQQDEDDSERYYSQGQGQVQHQGHTYQVQKDHTSKHTHQKEENDYQDDQYEYHNQSTKGYDKKYPVKKGQGQNWKKQLEGHYEDYDRRVQSQHKVKETGHYDKHEWVSGDEDYKTYARGREIKYEDGPSYDKHSWSVSDEGDGYDDDGEDTTQYQYNYSDSYSTRSQYAKPEVCHHKLSREAYPTNSGSQGKKQPKVPVLYPKEPSAKLHRQSLKNLQERRNTLLAQLQELNKQFEGHYNDKEEIMEEIWNEDTRRLEEKGLNVDQSLPDLFRPQYEMMQVDESEAYMKTLEHPHPLDVGPVSLKAELISNGDIFERLGAISGVPPRQVNDSIMTSWMTSSLNNVAAPENEDYSYINTSMTNTANTKVQNTYTLNNQPTSKPVKEVASSGQRKKSTDGWRNIDKDFPYLKDVTSNLESPMPTPPTTPKPFTSQHNLPTPSHQSVVYNQSTITASSTSRPNVSSSYTASNYMSSSVSQSSRDKSTYHDSYATPSSWNTHHSPQTNVHTPSRNTATTTIYNSIANYESGDNYMTKTSSYIPASYGSEDNQASAYGSTDNYWTSNSQTTAYESSSPLAYFSCTSSNFTEDHIPFVEGSPTISKFGPISRNKQVAKNTALLKATADETVKTLPVTAVTPIEGPPLPNASTVPSRFTREEAGQYSTKEIPTETKVTFDKVYSLWASEVNLLEQKAQEASTEDEKLSVKLQAVEMQITLKQQELKQAQAVNLSTSEYMKRELIPTNMELSTADQNLPSFDGSFRQLSSSTPEKENGK